jgi:exopolyphosphatase / guanosine-5'-triphosphate,3'-diphosphate pyrophosphatase
VHKKAVIDLGTNTFNLLIAEVDITQNHFHVLYSEKKGVALGMGGINEQKIGTEAFERGIQALIKFKSICNEYHVESIRAIGTSALRDAKNSHDFVAKAFEQTGLKVEIISGDEEAYYIYQGVCWSFDFKEPSLIMDIGGGSTEFILADKNGIQSKISFNIGVSRIFQEFSFSDPYTTEDVVKIEQWLEDKTQGYFDTMSCNTLVGASGSFETFHEMIHLEAFQEKVASKEIPFNLLIKTLDELIYSTQTERDLHPFIIPIRRKMAPIAAVKTKWVIEKIGASRTVVTPCSLKEGVLRTH